MIKTLQKKFMITAMTAVSVLILLMLAAINIINYISNERQIEHNLLRLAEDVDHIRFGNQHKPMPDKESGKFPPLEILSEEFFEPRFTPYFLVRFAPDGSVFLIHKKLGIIMDAEAETYAKTVYEGGRTSGRLGDFRYAVFESENGLWKTVVFLNDSVQIASMVRVFVISVIIGLVSFLVMLLLVSVLSRRAILPIARNMEKQREFVTNAGHEIKTPLAIILANVEAMELHNGENKWSRNIRTQTTRLNGLTKNLLLLSKMDEGTAAFTKNDVSLSGLLKENVDAYTESASLKKIQIHTDIAPDIFLHLNRENLVQLISIMMDNAIKYTNEGGTIRIALQRENKRLKMQFSNTCEQLPKDNPERLFERFYRADSARTQENGGYGIGLSVARAIVENFSGRIYARYDSENEITFVVELDCGK